MTKIGLLTGGAVVGAIIVAGFSASAWAEEPPKAPITQSAGAGDWPQWRGPRGDALPAIQNLPQDFEKGFKKLWEVQGLCVGKNAAAWSCPVIVGDKVIVMGRDNAKDLLVCLNVQTGKEIWRKDYDAPGADVQYGNGPRATPTVEDGKIYTFGCMGQIACWELESGKPVWMKTADEFGGQQPKWGFSSSPLVYDGKVIVQTGGKSVAVALDKKTGEKVWASIPGSAGYAAPVVVQVAGKPQVVVFAGDALLGLDPRTGQQPWKTPWPTAMAMNCTTPVMVNGKLLISSTNFGGKSGGSGLFELTAEGPKAVWTNVKLSAPHNDPVVLDGYMYAYSGFSGNDKGDVAVVCADVKTGEIKWSSNELGGPGTVVQVGKEIVCLNNRGKMILLQPSPEGARKVTEFQAIPGFPVWTQPIFVPGKLFVRNTDRLVCYAIE